MNASEACKPELTLLDVMEQTYLLPLESSQTITTDFAELDDGTLVELVEDPADANNTLFAVWKDQKIEYLDELNDRGRILIPLSRTTEPSKALRPRSTGIGFHTSSAVAPIQI
jgi:hypothetical protein